MKGCMYFGASKGVFRISIIMLLASTFCLSSFHFVFPSRMLKNHVTMLPLSIELRDEREKKEMRCQSQTAYICEFNYIFMRVYLCRHRGDSFVLSQRVKHKMWHANSDSGKKESRAIFHQASTATATSSGNMSHIISVGIVSYYSNYLVKSNGNSSHLHYVLCFSNEKSLTMETAS